MPDLTNRYHIVFTICLMAISYRAIAQTPCINGKAGEYNCNQVDLMAHIPLSQFNSSAANDIWGWTDPENGAEIAIIGLRDKTAFVDITDPHEPIILGYLPQPSTARSGGSTWRDMKVYMNHVFVVSDSNEEHGMQVFDLTRLRAFAGSPITFTSNTVYQGVNSAHNIAINEETGFAYIVGARSAPNCGAGGLHIVDIRDPNKPEFAGCFDNDGYTHDTQCVVYRGADERYSGNEICFSSNENTITLTDVTNKSNPVLLSSLGYPQTAYTHQGWLTEDHQYFLLNDELDEQMFGFNTRTLIWDVRNLEAPILIGEYYADSKAIDHNLYNFNGLNYQANYLSGLRITDLSQIQRGQIREMGFFDTHPTRDVASFDGAWSVYPFFESGNVVVSDISKGLFVLRPNIENIITEHPQDISICDLIDQEGISISVDASVKNYQWQLITPQGPMDLEDGDEFDGSTTANLKFKTARPNIDEEKFRCKVLTEDGIINFSFFPEIEGLFPIPDFNFVNIPGAVNFENTSSRATGFEWDFGDGTPVSTEISPNHQYSADGSYTVKLSAFNDCGGAIAIKEIDFNISSLTDGSQFVLRIYPNPVHDFINIDSSDPELIVAMRMLTVNGKSVAQYSPDTKRIDTRHMPSGVYIIEYILKDGKKEHFKLLKK